MARKGRVDRGLVEKVNAAGKPVWYVRLQHLGREQWFGAFLKKTAARHFYEERKKEQREQRLFPQQYKLRGTDTMADIIAKYTVTLDGCGKKRATIAEERRYGAWWTEKLAGLRLNALTAEHLVVIGRGKLLADTSTQEFINQNSTALVRVRTPHLEELASVLGDQIAHDPIGLVRIEIVRADEEDARAEATHHELG